MYQGTLPTERALVVVVMLVMSDEAADRGGSSHTFASRNGADRFRFVFFLNVSYPTKLLPYISNVSVYQSY